MSIYIDVLCLILSMAFGLSIIDSINSHVYLHGGRQWSSVIDAVVVLFDIVMLNYETVFFASFLTGALVILTIAIALDNFNKIKESRKRQTLHLMSKVSDKFMNAHHLAELNKNKPNDKKE